MTPIGFRNALVALTPASTSSSATGPPAQLIHRPGPRIATRPKDVSTTRTASGMLLIAIGYVGFAAALGILAGGRLPVEIAVICTIVATLVFQPARRVLERLADRWVFGQRLGGYELLTRFGATLEGTIDPRDVGPRLAEMVRQGLNAEWVRVRIRRDPDG
jgi:hypothetical protein